MNFPAHILMLLVLSISFTVPAGAAVDATGMVGFCAVIAADDDKKTDGDKKPEIEGDEEPECD